MYLQGEFKVLSKTKSFSIITINAGVVQWQNATFPKLSREFDSLHPLQAHEMRAVPDKRSEILYVQAKRRSETRVQHTKLVLPTKTFPPEG